MTEGKDPRVSALAAFLRARRGEERVTFRIEPPGQGRAFAQGPCARTSYLERTLPPSLASRAPALRDAIARADGVHDAARRLTDVLGALDFAVDRRDEPPRSIRRHPAGQLRPRADLPLLDAELLGLARGLRRLAKRMCPPGGAADRVARIRTLGLLAEPFGVTSHGTAAPTLREVILVGIDDAALREGRAVEAALVRAADTRTDDEGAVRAMGALLGYPACCVARFVTLRARDDGSLAGALLPALGAVTPFATAFTIPPFSLISHAPCEPGCAETRALVAATLDGAPAHVREAYRALAAARWGVAPDGSLVREVSHRDGPRATCFDIADPQLPASPWCAPDGTTLDLEGGGACWRIETVPGDELSG